MIASDEFGPHEIFATGSYPDVSGKPVQFTTADLEQIAQNFTRLKDTHKVPLKLGHSEKQVFAGQSDGMPALGWISRVERQGGKLLAWFKGVPNVVRRAIDAGLYRRISSELHLNWKNSLYERNNPTGTAGKVLEAAALLGADLPAVSTLADLGAYLTHPKQDNERLIATIGRTEDTMDEDIIAASLPSDSYAARSLNVRREQERIALAEQRRYDDEQQRLEAARQVEAEAKEERDAVLFNQRLVACMQRTGCYEKGGEKWDATMKLFASLFPEMTGAKTAPEEPSDPVLRATRKDIEHGFRGPE